MSTTLDIVTDFFNRESKWNEDGKYLTFGDLSSIVLPEGSDGTFMAAISCDQHVHIVTEVLGVESRGLLVKMGIENFEEEFFYVLNEDTDEDVGAVELVGEIAESVNSKTMRSIRDLRYAADVRLREATKRNQTPGWAEGDDDWVDRQVDSSYPVMFVAGDGGMRSAVGVEVSDEGDVVLLCRGF